MAKTAVEVLTEAKNMLMEYGVGREAFYDTTTNSYCSLGAIEVAAGIRNKEHVTFGFSVEERWRLRERAADFLYDVMKNVPYFNDNHTPGEVLAKFDEAITLAKQLEADNNE